MTEYEIHLERLINEYLLDLWSDGKVITKFKQKTFNLMVNKNIIVADTAIVVWMTIQTLCLPWGSVFSIRLQENKMMMLIRKRVFF